MKNKCFLKGQYGVWECSTGCKRENPGICFHLWLQVKMNSHNLKHIPYLSPLFTDSNLHMVDGDNFTIPPCPYKTEVVGPSSLKAGGPINSHVFKSIKHQICPGCKNKGDKYTPFISQPSCGALNVALLGSVQKMHKSCRFTIL